MGHVSEIGRCKGCDRMERVEDGVCVECLSSPVRGRRWAEMSHRCRTDREFARQVFARIDTQRGRALFTIMYGDPRAR